MNDTFARGLGFVLREGRVLERRLALASYGDGPVSGVFAALGAYRNDDGGFGHGLEPDKLCPASQPLDVEIALQCMAAVDAVDESLVLGACEWLQRIGEPNGGAVPVVFDSIAGW